MFDYIQNIKLGDKSLLTILNQNINDISKLNEAYSIIINEILASDYWSNNKINALKIKWQDGDIARSIRNDIDSPPQYSGNFSIYNISTSALGLIE